MWMPKGGLLGEHLLELLVREQDVVHGVSSVLEGGVVTVDVGWEEDFCKTGLAEL